MELKTGWEQFCSKNQKVVNNTFRKLNFKEFEQKNSIKELELLAVVCAIENIATMSMGPNLKWYQTTKHFGHFKRIIEQTG